MLLLRAVMVLGLLVGVADARPWSLPAVDGWQHDSTELAPPVVELGRRVLAIADAGALAQPPPSSVSVETLRGPDGTVLRIRAERMPLTAHPREMITVLQQVAREQLAELGSERSYDRSYKRGSDANDDTGSDVRGDHSGGDVDDQGAERGDVRSHADIEMVLQVVDGLHVLHTYGVEEDALWVIGAECRGPSCAALLPQLQVNTASWGRIGYRCGLGGVVGVFALMIAVPISVIVFVVWLVYLMARPGHTKPSARMQTRAPTA